MTPARSLLHRALFSVLAGSLVVGASACHVRRAVSAPVAAQAFTSSDASQVLALLNGFRAANGLAALTPAGDANAKAQQHSDEMAAASSLYHSSSLAAGIQPGWSMLGENVGVGGDTGQLEAMFEASAPHRENLLNAAYSQVGVGATRGADGRLYVTQFFVAR